MLCRAPAPLSDRPARTDPYRPSLTHKAELAGLVFEYDPTFRTWQHQLVLLQLELAVPRDEPTSSFFDELRRHRWMVELFSTG